MRSRAPTGSVPRTSSEPSARGVSPAMALSSVDLPEPFGPMTAVIRPSGMDRSEARKATRSP